MKSTDRESNKFVILIEYISELFVLNMVTLLCCLPIVTIGASLTAMHTILQKMVRKEEGYIVRPFFKAFKENFGQATKVWCIFLVILAPALIEIMAYLYNPKVLPKFIVVTAAVVSLFILMFAVYAFPFMAHFDSTVHKTLQMSMMLAAARFPRTCVMVFLTVLPFVLIPAVGMIFIPLIFLYGLSLPGYICARIYDHVLRELETA